MADTAITLLEAAKLLPENRKSGVIGTYAEAYQPMQVAPVIQSGMHYSWSVEDDLAHTSGGKRNINADFDSTQGNVAPYSTQLKIYGGQIKSDRYINLLSPQSIAFQEQSQINSFAREFTTDLFEGTGGTSLRGFKDWIDNDVRFNATQLVDAGATASGVLLSTDMLDEIISKVDVIDGQTAIYMSDTVARRYKRATKGQASNEPRIVYTPDQAGMWPGMGMSHNRSGVVATYDGIPIVNLKDGKGTDLLSVTEIDGAASQSNTSSVYIVVYGTEMVSLVANSNSIAPNGVPVPMVTGENEDNYKKETLEWFVSNVPHRIRSIARLRYVKQATS